MAPAWRNISGPKFGCTSTTRSSFVVQHGRAHYYRIPPAGKNHPLRAEQWPRTGPERRPESLNRPSQPTGHSYVSSKVVVSRVGRLIETGASTRAGLSTASCRSPYLGALVYHCVVAQKTRAQTSGRSESDSYSIAPSAGPPPRPSLLGGLGLWRRDSKLISFRPCGRSRVPTLHWSVRGATILADSTASFNLATSRGVWPASSFRFTSAPASTRS